MTEDEIAELIGSEAVNTINNTSRRPVDVGQAILAALRAKGMEVVSVEARPINLVGAWEKAGFYVPPVPKRTI